MRRLAPLDRLHALCDRELVALPPAGASPWLARYGINPHDDDGVVTARGAIEGLRCLLAAQDERFLGGAVGARHAAALTSLFEHAKRERARAVVLLLASGGVRLHEANAAELALARTLRALLDARASGVPVVGIAVGDVFGGTSVLACACDQLAMLPGTRLGLSGPKVIETARGKAELDAADDGAIEALFGVAARAGARIAEAIDGDPASMRAFVVHAIHAHRPFDDAVARTQSLLEARLAEQGTTPVAAMIARHDDLRLVAPAHGAFGPAEAIAIDAALRTVAPAEADPLTVVLEEDSTGHPTTQAAERLGVSQYLAHHAATLAWLRLHGHFLAGWLTGTGHSAAFFVNALQADILYVTPDARVMAMAPDAIARVTRLSRADLSHAIEDDPLLGHPVRHFAALGGVAGVIEDREALLLTLES